MKLKVGDQVMKNQEIPTDRAYRVELDSGVTITIAVAEGQKFPGNGIIVAAAPDKKLQ